MTDPNGSKRILVIDDEVSTLKMLRLLLRTYGYTVLTAESGEEGLDVFRKEAPQIVLTDIRMPGMSGIEVLQELKKINPEAEVIVFTGHGDMDLAIRSLQNDASDFINKPVQRQALEIALKRAEEKIGLRRQLKDYTLNLETKVAELTSNGTMEQRAQTLGYEPVDPTQMEYIVVPGYAAPEAQILSVAPALKPSAPSIAPEYTESLIEWLQQSLHASPALSLTGISQ